MELRAITFACYGTLVDAAAGLRAYLTPVLAKSGTSDGAKVPTPDAWVARYRHIEQQLLRPWRPYREVMIRSFEATMRHFALEAFVDDGPGLVRALPEWAPFADAAPSLRRLARRHRLAIVSNSDRDQLAGSVGLLLAPLSSLVTAEDARAYKPDPRPFALAVERLGVPAASILHVGTDWRVDLGPARAAGMAVAFVNRGGAPRPDGAPAELEVPSLAALATALGS